MTPFKSQPENEADILAVKDLLLACPTGETVTYEAASNAIGRDIQTDARYILTAAVRAAEEQAGSRFGCVTRVGIKRLPVEDIPALGVSYITKARRAAQRGLKRLSGVRDNAPAAIQQKINAQCAQLGAVALIARNESTRKIEAQTEAGHVLPIGRTLSLFTRAES